MDEEEKFKPKEVETTYEGGLEAKLEILANWILGCLLLVSCSVLFWVRESPITGILTMTVVLLAAAAGFLFFRFLAEMLRLHKRRNGLPYSGEISQAEEVKSFSCGKCEKPIFNWSLCPHCGATVDKADA